MKRYVCTLLVAVLIAIPFRSLAQTTTGTVLALDNQAVIKMLGDGFSPEIVIAKINTSSTAFDTSLDGMASLKKASVPDDVLLAMLRAGTAKDQPAVEKTALASEPVEVKVIDGQQMEVELSRAATSEGLKIGNIVDFSVTKAVVVDGFTIIEKGAPARATITTAKRAGHWGKAGKLEWVMKDVMTVDGNRIPLRFTQRTTGDSKGGTVAVAAVATTILLGPLGLLWGLKKGKPVEIPAGNLYSVFVNGDTTVKVVRAM
jgi:hypothetical protein